MRVLSAILLTSLLGLTLPGCSLFKKNTGGAADGYTPPAPPSAVPTPKFPTADSKGDPLNGQTRAPTANGMLAGRVLDGAARPPGGTSILVVAADAKDDAAGRELSVSPEGYFTIENLNPGGQYKLVARGRQGDRAVAGIHYATAPNVHVLIQMKEDLVSSATPAVSGPFGSLKDDKKFQPLVPPKARPAVAKDGWRPGEGIDVASGEVTLPPVHVQSRPDGFAATGNGWIPPPLEIRPPTKTPEFAKIATPSLPPKTAEAPATLGTATTPSCVLVGRQLVNFSLNDINGEPWELKANRKGRLVLLDFWGSWCVPCRQTMPALKGLQAKYGGQGLEVIGIAYEQGGSPQEQAYRVNDVCQKLLINYRQLLGSGPSCVVKTQLGIRAFPTLVLIDEQGNILWRHEGRPSSLDLEELERLIQSRARAVAG